MDRYEVIEANADGKLMAARLISRVYSNSGYVSEGESLPDVSSFLNFSSTVTLLAMRGGKLAGTLSLFFDGENKLPMDAIFTPELNVLRAKNLRLVEVGQFAVSQEEKAHGVGMMLGPSRALFKEALRVSLERKADVICIAINPKHEKFYKLMGFAAWEGVRDYPSVNNAPAVGMYLYTADITRGNIKSMLLQKFLG